MMSNLNMKDRISNLQKLFIPVILEWKKEEMLGHVHFAKIKNHEFRLLYPLTGFTIEWKWIGSSSEYDTWVRWDASICEYKISRKVPENLTHAYLYYDDGFDLRVENHIQGIWPDLEERSKTRCSLRQNVFYEERARCFLDYFFLTGERIKMQHNPQTCNTEARPFF